MSSLRSTFPEPILPVIGYPVGRPDIFLNLFPVLELDFLNKSILVYWVRKCKLCPQKKTYMLQQVRKIIKTNVCEGIQNWQIYPLLLLLHIYWNMTLSCILIPNVLSWPHFFLLRPLSWISIGQFLILSKAQYIVFFLNIFVFYECMILCSGVLLLVQCCHNCCNKCTYHAMMCHWSTWTCKCNSDPTCKLQTNKTNRINLEVSIYAMPPCHCKIA